MARTTHLVALALGLAAMACGPDEVAVSGDDNTGDDSSESSSESIDETETESGTETETTGEPEPDPVGTCSLIWQQTRTPEEGFEGQAWDFAFDTDQNLYVAGGRSYTPYANGVGWLAKYDPEGALLWWQSYPDIRQINHLHLSDEGSLYVLGVAFAMELDRPWVAHVSAADGALLWGHPQPELIEANALTLDLDDSLLVTGAIETDEGPIYSYDAWLGRFATDDGAALWSTSWEPTFSERYDRGRSVAVGPQGTIYVGGSDGLDNASSAAMLWGFEGGDEPAWSLNLGTDSLLSVEYVGVDPAGDLVVWTGTNEGANTIMKLEAETREVVWSKSGEQLEHLVIAVGVDSEGNVLAGQQVDLTNAAIRTWTNDGDPLCIEDMSFTTGDELLTQWFAGAGPIASVAAGGISVETASATLHFGRWLLD